MMVGGVSVAAFSGGADAISGEGAAELAAVAPSAASAAVADADGVIGRGAGAIRGRGGQAGTAVMASSGGVSAASSSTTGASRIGALSSPCVLSDGATAATRPANRPLSAAVSTDADAPTWAVGAIRDMTLSADMRGDRAFAGWAAPTALRWFERHGASSGPSQRSKYKSLKNNNLY
ncbi:hypothetical protein D3C72_1058420 [compost metagenome]